jgi:hypothetical protein
LDDAGIYVIEDLCCSYWPNFNSIDAPSAMEFFKELVDVLNAEHWCDDHFRYKYTWIEKYKVFSNESFNIEALLSNIRSIKFYNSMCVVEKCKKEIGTIGPRFVTGSKAPVGFYAENGQRITSIKPCITPQKVDQELNNPRL